MSVPPIIGYIVLAGFVIGILSPLLLAAIGQRKRPGAMAGLIAGSLLSIPAGLFSGMYFWSYFEEATAMSRTMVIFAGPLFGCFIGTLSVALLTREVGAAIGANRTPRAKQPAN